MKVLFIGGTGVISTEVSKLCIRQGIDLYLLNRGKSIRPFPEGAKHINIDYRDFDAMQDFLVNERFDSVVDWIAFTEDQIKHAHNLFKGKIDQFIFISSASAYQKPLPEGPITEKTPLENPFWEYSRNKIKCENYLMKAYKDEGFPVTICRPSHTYDQTKIPFNGDYSFLDRIKRGKEIIIHNDGNSKWTLTNSKDFAKGFVGLIGNPKTIGEAYHITSDATLTWNEIAETIARNLGAKLNAVHIPGEFIKKMDDDWGDGILGDKAYNGVFDNSKIKALVPGFKAEISFDDGIKDVIKFYEEHPELRIIDEDYNSKVDVIIESFKESRSKHQ